jgi:hypothetical protein
VIADDGQHRAELLLVDEARTVFDVGDECDGEEEPGTLAGRGGLAVAVYSPGLTIQAA